MRTVNIMLALLVSSVAAIAAPTSQTLTATLGTNTSSSVISAGVEGYVEAVYVSVSDAASTGTVAVSYAPTTGSTAVNISTNSVIAEKVWRPRIDATGIDGEDLSSDTPVRFALGGETITFAVSDSPTGLVWKCVLIVDEK